MGRLSCKVCFIFFLLSSAAFSQSQKSEFLRPAPFPVAPPRQPVLVEGAPIRDATVDIQLSGVAATTTIDLTLGNASSVAREATVNLPIAAGQQMARFALDFNGQLRYAVAVEKSRGREVFEAIERRRVDPALLEKTEGDNFRLRVFPIMPQATRKARFELIQPAAGDVIRLAPPSDALNKLDHFTAKLHVSGETAPEVQLGGRTLHAQAEPGGFVVQIDDHQWSNAVPIEVRRHTRRMAVAIDASGKDHWLVADMPVPVPGGTRRIAPAVELLWDSSASHSKQSADLEIAELDSYFKTMGNGEVHLQRLRDHAEPMQRFSVNHGDWTELRDALRKTVYDGATALSDFTVEPDVSEVLLVSDGLSNYDNKAFPHLASNQHLFAMSAATSANRDFLNAICAENHGRFAAIDTSRPTGSTTKRLTVNTSDVDVGSIDGITDVVLDRSEIAQGHVRVAARVLRDSGHMTLLITAPGRSSQETSVSFDDQTPQQNDLAVFWARYSIAELAANPDHHAAVRRIGERFQLATDETSLLVLETAADYVRYNVPAPRDLRDEVARMGMGQTQNEAALQAQHLESIVQELREKKAWYDARHDKKYTPEKTPAPMLEPSRGVSENRQSAMPLTMAAAAPPPPPARAMSAPAPMSSNEQSGASLDRVVVTGSNLKRADVEAPSPVQIGAPDAAAGTRFQEAKAGSGDSTEAGDAIHLQAYLPDSPYGQKLRGASTSELYAMYLDERPDYQASPAFYLDVADLLFAKGQRELGLRVLSNLAELDLNNRQVLRVLGYRLMQAKEPELAIMVFKRVRELAPNEPQSFRDLGLAQAAAHHDQEAINNFAEVMLKPWDPRFSEVELITLADLNAAIAAADHSLDVSRIDPRLLVNMPLDVRAVLTWDASDSDLDLWVTDPDGELCRYDHRFTLQGGRLSRDVTTGYGPEEFSLKHAKPGHYKIEVNYFGANAQLVSGVITATVHLTTAFGSTHPQDKALTVRLHQKADRVLIGEFDIQP
jgi:tetratricopeptide (TPR) repeat protein